MKKDELIKRIQDNNVLACEDYLNLVIEEIETGKHVDKFHLVSEFIIYDAMKLNLN
jgi:hypothetical protein